YDPTEIWQSKLRHLGSPANVDRQISHPAPVTWFFSSPLETLILHRSSFEKRRRASSNQRTLINDKERRPTPAAIRSSLGLTFDLLSILAGFEASPEDPDVQADIARVLFELGFGEGQATLILK